MYSPGLGRFVERMPWWSFTTPAQLVVGHNDDGEETLVKGERFTVQIWPFHRSLMGDEWASYFDRAMIENAGGYFDQRMSLYDFNKGDPANRVEPFSGTVCMAIMACMKYPTERKRCDCICTLVAEGSDECICACMKSGAAGYGKGAIDKLKKALP